jgi:hypothetical protein
MSDTSIEQRVEDVRKELRELEHELVFTGTPNYELGKAVKAAARELETPGVASALQVADVDFGEPNETIEESDEESDEQVEDED